MAELIDLYLGGVIDSYIQNDCIVDARYDTPVELVLMDLTRYGLTNYQKLDYSAQHNLWCQFIRMMKIFYKSDTVYERSPYSSPGLFIKGLLIKNYREGNIMLDVVDEDETFSIEYAIEDSLFRDELLKEQSQLPLENTTKIEDKLYPYGVHILKQPFEDGELEELR